MTPQTIMTVNTSRIDIKYTVIHKTIHGGIYFNTLKEFTDQLGFCTTNCRDVGITRTQYTPIIKNEFKILPLKPTQKTLKSIYNCNHN